MNIIVNSSQDRVIPWLNDDLQLQSISIARASRHELNSWSKKIKYVEKDIIINYSITTFKKTK